MPQFFPTKSNNPCPICGDTSGDCRTTQENLILCHSFIETDSGVAGYKFVKTSSNIVWGVHVPDNGKEFDKQKYERYKEQKAEQERNKKQFLADNALDANGRDRAIRKLSRYVGLDSSSREDLRRRGLSSRAIEAGLFFSIDPWIRFNLDLPDNLPGIHWKGDRFATSNSGYACPIFDKEGRAHGWQLRVEGVTKGNKYKWAKSNFSSHLPNSELPITLVKPNENSCSTLYLTEGILKPLIAANNLNLPVCGAASGYFSGSPEQFASILADYDELAIAPDAGDVLNPQVMQRWQKQIGYLLQFNKPIKILWWGQTDKNKAKDIDEIDSVTFSKLEYLTLSEFTELARKQQWVKQQGDNWRNYKKFTPQIKIKKRFVEFGLPQKNTITFVKSGLGTGKTTQIIQHLSQLKDYGIIGLGYRNTLLLQFNEKAKEIGFYHLQSDKNLREFSLNDPAIKVTNCIDSLIHYQKEQFDGKIIVIDEIVSVIKHLLFSSTIKHFALVKELFTEMVNRADRIICLDGFMQDWVVKLFQELCPSKQTITIENMHSCDKAKIYLLEGTIDINEKLRVNDKTPWLEKLLFCDCPAICSNSQIFCEAIENLLLEQGRVGIRVDSKTVSDSSVKDFFTNPDKWISKNNPEYLIYSPSAESGLDVPIKNYFTEHFAFFFGQLDIDSCIQMLGRIRDVNVPKYVWCKQFVITEDTARQSSNIVEIQAMRARNLMKELHSTLFDNVDSSEAKIARLQEIYQANLDPLTTAADTVTAIRNYEKANYRECFKQQLIESGYTVETVTLELLSNRQEITRLEKEAKTEVKEQNSRDIYHASDRYIGQSNLNLNFDASWETRCEVIKAQLVNRLPEINKSNVWSPEFIKKIKYDKTQLVRVTELYYLLENPEVARGLAVEKYNGIFNSGSIAAPWKLRQDYLKVKALRNVGIWDFIKDRINNSALYWTANTPSVKAILTECRKKKNYQVLGKPHVDSLKFLHKLLRSVGVEVKSKKVKRSGKTTTVYFLDLDNLLSQERLAILKAIRLKYEQKINRENQPLEWVDSSANSRPTASNQLTSQKIAENHDSTLIESVTFYPYTYINNSANCNPLNSNQVITNLPEQIHNTNQIQNPYDTEEAIADLADWLRCVECSEGLRELQQVPEFTPTRLRKAFLLLSIEKINQIKEFAIINSLFEEGSVKV